MVMLAVIIARRLFKFPVAEESVRMLARYLIVAILVLMYMIFSEFLTVGYSGTVPHLAVFNELLFGRFSKIFWFDAVIGLLVPLLLLGMPKSKRSTATIGLAALLVVVGVFAERLYLLLPSLMRPAAFTGAVHVLRADNAGMVTDGRGVFAWLPVVPGGNGFGLRHPAAQAPGARRASTGTRRLGLRHHHGAAPVLRGCRARSGLTSPSRAGMAVE